MGSFVSPFVKTIKTCLFVCFPTLWRVFLPTWYTHKGTKQMICCHGEFHKIDGSSRDDPWLINDQLEISRRKLLSESTVEHWKVLNYSLEKRKTVALICILWWRNRCDQVIKPHSTFDNNHLSHIKELKSSASTKFGVHSHMLWFFFFLSLSIGDEWEVIMRDRRYYGHQTTAKDRL